MDRKTKTEEVYKVKTKGKTTACLAEEKVGHFISII